MASLSSRDYESILKLAGDLVGELASGERWKLVFDTLMTELSAPVAGVFEAGPGTALDEMVNADIGRPLRLLVIPLGAPPGRMRALIVGRAGADFTSRDHAYALRLRLVVLALDRRHRAATRPGWVVKTRLTPRELAVLELLAQGRTAAAMARALAITAHTVAKHQQNIYRKLGTNDRLTTVLLARDLNLLTRY